MIKERLQELLNHEHLTPVRFAELVEVQRSSVSHVLSGRNKPSLDFIHKILAAFPHVNPDWLIMGEGSYKRVAVLSSKASSSPGHSAPEPNASNSTPPIREEAPAPYGRQGELFDDTPSDSESVQTEPLPESESGTHRSIKKDEPRVVKMVFFYSDHTFEIFHPGR